MLGEEWTVTDVRDATGTKRSNERRIFFAVVVRRNAQWTYYCAARINKL